MKRILLAACALLALAGCASTPAGVDGDLVDDWVALGEAKVPEPAVGDCWTTPAWTAYDEIAFAYTKAADCAADHQMETVHVGRLTGELAAASQVPTALQLSALYPECEKTAEQHLGAPWQTGRLYLYLRPPTDAQWRGGARFFRCDVATVDGEADRLVPHTGTLKDALRPGGARTIGCANEVVKNDDIVDLTPVACTAPHTIEFVGFARRADVQAIPPGNGGVGAIFSDGCQSQLLSYTGMSRSHLNRYRIGYIMWVVSAGRGWLAGDHSARCYLSVDKKLTRSLKAAGNVAI